MAGSQNSEDNPVSINVTAMVDVIFCLCLFFMCSMHFKQLEGKIDSWLPKERGNQAGKADSIVLEEIRVLLRWDPQTGATSRRVGSQGPAAGDDALIGSILAMASDHKKIGTADPRVVIDATSAVPWREVVRVMDLCRARGLSNLELTEPMAFGLLPEPGRGRPR